MVVAEAALEKNAFLSVHVESSYKALYGRVPNMLPSITDITGLAHLDDREAGQRGLSRHDIRIG